MGNIIIWTIINGYSRLSIIILSLLNRSCQDQNFSSSAGCGSGMGPCTRAVSGHRAESRQQQTAARRCSAGPVCIWFCTYRPPPGGSLVGDEMGEKESGERKDSDSKEWLEL